MAKLRKRSKVQFVEPINIFEQLEERIVLDAAITAPPHQDPPHDAGSAQPNAPIQVNVQANSEASPTFSYDTTAHDGQHGLEVKAPAAADFVTWQQFNATKDPANQIQFNYESSAGKPVGYESGQMTWTPGTQDTGVYTFRVNSVDTDPGSGAASDSVTFQLTVNSAPTLTQSVTPNALNATDEDHTSVPVSVSDIVGSMGTTISDPDPGALQGIAIVGVGSTNGQWEFSIDAGAHWTTFTASESSALLLAPDASLRFVPNQDYNGAVDPGITFRAWDQTEGTNGGSLGRRDQRLRRGPRVQCPD